MVRYKRYRRYRRRSTNTIMMKFQSFMDISTSDSSMQIITVSAGGSEIMRRLAPQFGAYKYYKIGNIAIKLVPASTLPVDPTGLSYESGEQTVDPRDQLTPGLIRITNGEDIFENISGLTEADQRAIFNNMLLDNRWFKWMLQSGVKRHATPRYWQIGQLHQDKWPGAITNLPRFNADGKAIGTSKELKGVDDTDDSIDSIALDGSTPYGFFQTGHRGVLGWLPTDGLQPFYGNNGVNQPMLASPPEVEVMKIILPRAYKTKYYYRMFITETVYFREPIVTFGIPREINGHIFRPLDIFHGPGVPKPLNPNDNDLDFSNGVWPTGPDNGGNYGNN